MNVTETHLMSSVILNQADSTVDSDVVIAAPNNKACHKPASSESILSEIDNFNSAFSLPQNLDIMVSFAPSLFPLVFTRSFLMY